MRLNPWLQEHWFTRLLAPAIVNGATFKESDYRLIGHHYWMVVFLVAVFGGNVLLDSYTFKETVVVVTFLTLLVATVPAVVATRIGYQQRQRINADDLPYLALSKKIKSMFFLIVAAPWVAGALSDFFT